MNIKVISALSILGIVLSVARIFWVSSSDETLYWIGIYVVAPFVIARFCQEKFFINGFVLAVLYSFFILIFQLYFYDEYVLRHASESVNSLQTEESYEGFLSDSPKMNMIISIPFYGILKGVLLGFCAHIASFIVDRKEDVPEVQG